MSQFLLNTDAIARTAVGHAIAELVPLVDTDYGMENASTSRIVDRPPQKFAESPNVTDRLASQPGRSSKSGKFKGTSLAVLSTGLSMNSFFSRFFATRNCEDIRVADAP